MNKQSAGLASLTGIALVVILIVAAMIVAVPLVVIWAVNTLFSVGIAYTVYNWLAMLILLLTFGASRVRK
jgi:hypothetical protein